MQITRAMCVCIYICMYIYTYISTSIHIHINSQACLLLQVKKKSRKSQEKVKKVFHRSHRHGLTQTGVYADVDAVSLRIPIFICSKQIKIACFEQIKIA